jgi:hypothetical protein
VVDIGFEVLMTDSVPYKMREHSTKHVAQARFNIAMIKWMTIASLLCLPFSFVDGIADWRYLVVAPFAGFGWIMVQCLFWRSESMLTGGLGFLFVIVVHHLSDNVYAGQVPMGHFAQWMASFLVVVAIPVVLFRGFVLKFCGL